MNGSMGMSGMSGMGSMGSGLSGGFGGGSGSGMSPLDRGLSEIRSMSAERMGRDNLGMSSLGPSMPTGGLSNEFRASNMGSLGGLSGMRDFPGGLGDMRSSMSS